MSALSKFFFFIEVLWGNVDTKKAPAARKSNSCTTGAIL
jgi:hypothetical protein